MAIPLNDNIEVIAPKPTDSRYFASSNIPWVSVAAVNAGINISKRYIGLTVNINNQEYWYKDDVTDSGLILKTPNLTNKADLENGIVPASQLPSYIDEVIEVANLAALPTIGISGKIYVTIDNNKTYRWSGTIYVEISAGVNDHTQLSNIGTNTHNQIDGHIVSTNNPHAVTKAQIGLSNVPNLSFSGTNTGDETTLSIQAKRPLKTIENQSLEGNGNIDLTKNDVGLGNVDNTTDIDKPISTDTQIALDAKQDTLLIGDEFYYDANGILRPNITTYRQVEFVTNNATTIALDFEPTFIYSVIKDGICLLQNQYTYTAPNQISIPSLVPFQTIEITYDKFIIEPQIL